MSRLTKPFVTGLSCILLLCLGSTVAWGDSTTSPATGTISGTVTGVNGPTSGVTIKVFPFHGKGARSAGTATTGKHRKHGPAAGTAVTDTNGAFSIPNLPDGNYIVVAILKGVGTGHAKADLSGTTVSVSITLTNHRAKNK